MNAVWEYIQKTIISLVTKKAIVLAFGSFLTISGIFCKYIQTRLANMDSKINNAVIIPTINTSVNHYKVLKTIESSLINCKQKGVFIGWAFIQTVYDTYTGQCDSVGTCPISHYAVYFDSLMGVWEELAKVENTKNSNPYYERTDLVLDEQTRDFFLNSSLYKNGIVDIDERVAKQYKLKFLKELYENLDLRNEGLTLEKIYIKPVLYKKDLIMIFSLSFVAIPKYNTNCYDKNLQAQGVILNNLAESTLTQYGIKN